ncbi:MAG: glycosyltransferase family 2 protein [Thomasclavelia sp.]|uniref:glycosyltransferase family 2 protein n=1 Tax=Thomasclavelia sp. TaxID=3025757 RepID=UPI0039A20A86
MDVSIVIPTKNGGELLNKVLTKIEEQVTKYQYEIICVDSGSKDDTIEIIKKHNCKLYQIKPSDFGHGKTRNYGASKGTGKYIIFITQDALPYNEVWLEELVSAMERNPDVVGAFGAHKPYEDCNIFDKRDITLHFQGFGQENTIYQLEDKKRYETEEGYRHLLAYYSDNNSCMRRDIWNKYPYDDVNFAEDQIWARKMIELGYKKLFCPKAIVYHSHNYKLTTYFSRFYDEFKGLYELHQYVIVNRKLSIIVNIYRTVRNDIYYLKSLNISKKEKIKWANYSFWKTCYRYIGGYLGGNYHRYSKQKQEFLDKHISQQYKQRNR